MQFVLDTARLRFVDNTPEVEVLHGIWPHFLGNGYATEAARAVIPHGFEICKLERLVAGADPSNVASVRVMETLGMTYDRDTQGNGLDMISFVMTKANWERMVNSPMTP